MTTIIQNGYTVLNKNAGPSGVAVQGDASAGSISQYNNNEADTITVGDASKDGSTKQVIATDSVDTVNLGSGWTKAGTETDQTTGITGTLYTSSSGDQVLISGGATVNNATPGPTPTPTASGSNGTPTATASPSPTPTAGSTGGNGVTPAAKPKTPFFNGLWNSITSYMNKPVSTYHGYAGSYSGLGSYGGGFVPSGGETSSLGDAYFAPSDLGEI